MADQKSKDEFRNRLIPWFLWGVFLVAAALIPFLFREDWKKFFVKNLPMIEKTVDCGDGKPDDTIDVLVQSAEKIFRQGFAPVIVSSGDGCYHLQSKLVLSSIVRTAKSRRIYRRTNWGKVVVSMILKARFSDLNSAQKRYVSAKFKKQARRMVYNIVTLTVPPLEYPTPPTIFPRTHPAAEIIDMKEALSLVSNKRAQLVSSIMPVDPRLKGQKVAVAEGLLATQIADPESKQMETTSNSLGMRLEAGRPVVVVSTKPRDIAAYNLVSAVFVRGFSPIYWVRDDETVPQQITGLETVDCWQALRLIKEGVVSKEKAEPGRKALWRGKTEYDREYAENLQKQMRSDSHGILGYWLPGGEFQLRWCAKHDLGSKFEWETEI